MWFRPGNGQSVDFDKFRVSSFRRRIRGARKTPEKGSSTESENVVITPKKVVSKANSTESSTSTTKDDEKEEISQEKPLQPPRRKHKKSASAGDDPLSSSTGFHSSLSRRLGRSFGEKEKEPEKEKVLLTDRKFKNNRVEKSSSKGKGLNDLDKRESMKGRRDPRKISAPPILDGKTANGTNGTNGTKTGFANGILSPAVAVVKKNARAHSNLNLSALYKLVGSGSKKLSSEDFERIRRKSLSEAAAPMIAVATSKQLPLVSNNGTTSPSTESNSRNNRTQENSNDKNDQCIRSNCNLTKTLENTSGNHDEGDNCINDINSDLRNSQRNDENDDKEIDHAKNVDDEVFLGNSNIEQDNDNDNDQKNDGQRETGGECGVSNKNINKKISSPSLTSRMAAKITETTNNYKNRRSKTPKKRKNSRRSEFHKQSSTDRPHSTSVVRQPSDRRPDLASTSFSSSGTTSQNTSDLTPSHGSFDTDSNAVAGAESDSKRDRSKSKSAPVSVNRSESYKERLSHKRNRTNRRKTSDPSLSKTNDEQQPELGLSNANYTASSSSSLSSSSLESPSTSLEQVGGPQPPPLPGGHPQTGPSGPGPGGPSFPISMTTASGTVSTPRQWVDSEDETDFTEIDWSSNLSAEVLESLSNAEKKRQEIINEIYQTERNHVRTLRLLEGLFLRPLQESGALPNDHLQILFPPALFSLKELHGAFEQKLKQRRIEHGYIVQRVGDLLIEMFDGHSGDELRDYSAQFCSRQQIALEALKEKRRKDENLQRLLTKAESHKACRRLQLKDLLPTVMQRLTKYPLLFENLHKITKKVVPHDEKEANAIQKALNSTKKILSDVNQAVEDAHKLQTIQRKLVKSSLDRDEFRNLDLTQYKLIYDGPLSMKKAPKDVQLHGLLFENMMVLLHKQDDKYFLKNFGNKTDENNKCISPITHFGQKIVVRQSAVDQNEFFLLTTETSHMFELKAPTGSERETWITNISAAAEQYKSRSKSSHDVVEDPASATIPHSNTKESLESTPERITAAASAASSTTPASDNVQHSHQQLRDRNDSFSNLRNKSFAEDTTNQIEKASNNNTGSHDGPTSITVASSKKSSSTDERDKQEDLRPNHDDNSRRDSVYSNNSNNTRTLMQMCPLLEPSEIQISISPAPIAEPVVTPAERLKQLDQVIRDRLAEKQKIICDMFRVPNEHFAEIADVAAQPEAPKDSANIALAAFAQVQSLIEVLNEHMKVTTVQEISAVSTAVCDQCHYRNMNAVSSPMLSSIGSTNTGTTVIPNSEQNYVQNSSSYNNSSNGARNTSLDDTIIQEDDGYCEIDELRLPAVMPNPLNNGSNLVSSGQLQQQQQKPLTSTLATATPQPSSPPSVYISSSTPELVKRQSTISADSIPEETEQDITNDEQATSNSKSSPLAVSKVDEESTSAVQSQSTTLSEEQQKGGLDDSLNNSEHIEINETYDTTTNSINKSVMCTPSHQLQSTFGHVDLCGPNRLSHVQSLEPTIPCHLVNGIVTALGAQISLLLPKINEREIERERLRRENQRLREQLNSMHENRRVAEEMETPDITESAKKNDEQQDNDEETLSSLVGTSADTSNSSAIKEN